MSQNLKNATAQTIPAPALQDVPADQLTEVVGGFVAVRKVCIKLPFFRKRCFLVPIPRLPRLPRLPF